MSALREPLNRLHTTLESAIESLHANVAALTDAQLCWRPAPGAWSVAEVIEHLSEIAEHYVDRVERAVEQGRAQGLTSERTEYRYGWFMRTFIRAAGPEGGKVKAPKMFRPQESAPEAEFAALARQAVLSRFDGLHERLLAAIRAADGLDLRRARLANPLLSLIRMPLGGTLEVLVGHVQRHLAQIERLRAHPNLPPATATTATAAPRDETTATG